MKDKLLKYWRETVLAIVGAATVAAAWAMDAANVLTEIANTFGGLAP